MPKPPLKCPCIATEVSQSPPPSTPVVSLSSTSSSSLSVALDSSFSYPLKSGGAFQVNANNGSASSNGSKRGILRRDPKSRNVTKMTNDVSNYYDIKKMPEKCSETKSLSKSQWVCPQCQGDVRQPSPEASISQSTVFCETDKELRQSLRLAKVMCSIPGCIAPRYHLTCSGIPPGSRLFRNAFLSSQRRNRSKYRSPPSPKKDASIENTPAQNRDVDGFNQSYSSTGSKWLSISALKSGTFENYEEEDPRHHSPQIEQATNENIFRPEPASSRHCQQLRRHSIASEHSPMSSVSFLCPSCDVEGTSRYLLEYFERFHCTKRSFYSEHLGSNKGCKRNRSGVRFESLDECVEARTGVMFLQHLMINHDMELDRHRSSVHSVRTEEMGFNSSNIDISYTKKSEKSTSPLTVSIAEPLLENWKPSELRLAHISKVIDSLSEPNQCQHHGKNDVRRRVLYQNEDGNMKGEVRHTPFHSESRSDSQANGRGVLNNAVQISSINPSYLVGMPIRLFNPVDNSYHSGRIIKCKASAPFAPDKPLPVTPNQSPIYPNMCDLIDEELSQTLFLVRFRHGVEGRMVAVHQWLYLEEHAVTVGGGICWAKVGSHAEDQNLCQNNEIKDQPAGSIGVFNTDSVNLINSKNFHNDISSPSGNHLPYPNFKSKTSGHEFISPYRPVQIIFRSALELLPVKDLNLFSSMKTPKMKNMQAKTNDKQVVPHLMVLAFCFGKACRYTRLALGGNSSMKSLRDETDNSTSQESAKDQQHYFLPFTSSVPTWLNRILHRARLSDEDLAIGVAMACMEQEEERRVRSWHSLPTSVPHHFKLNGMQS